MIKSKSDYLYYVREDASNNYRHGMYLNAKFIYWLLNLVVPGGIDPIWNFILTLRRLEYYTNCPTLKNRFLKIFAMLKFRKISLKLGFSIPINVFGPGLSIPHYGSIIVNPNAKIGRNCRIHAGTNIGMHKGVAPTIGDNVYIGPEAILFGGIEIVSNVSIGANATVTKSITEENVVVVGTSSSVIKHNSTPWNHGK